MEVDWCTYFFNTIIRLKSLNCKGDFFHLFCTPLEDHLTNIKLDRLQPITVPRDVFCEM